MVGRLLWEQDAAGSSPVTSTKNPNLTFWLGLDFLLRRYALNFHILPKQAPALGKVASAHGVRYSEQNEAQRSKFIGAPSRNELWVPQGGGEAEDAAYFEVSASASVGASVLRTEVSTGHPHPVTSTKYNNPR